MWRAGPLSLAVLLYPTLIAAADCDWWGKRTDIEKVVFLSGFFTGAQQPLGQLSVICERDENSEVCKFLPGLRKNLHQNHSKITASAESMIKFTEDVELICANPKLASGFDIQVYLHFLMSDFMADLERKSEQQKK